MILYSLVPRVGEHNMRIVRGIERMGRVKEVEKMEKVRELEVAVGEIK